MNEGDRDRNWEKLGGIKNCAIVHKKVKRQQQQERGTGSHIYTFMKDVSLFL